MKNQSYTNIAEGVGLDGWFKITLKRDDGKITKVTRARYALLVRDGRIHGEKPPSFFEGSK